MAHCTIVAEGVETTQEYDFIQHCGVDMVQGYYLAKPLPLATLAKHPAHTK
ncbi:MAG: EAL domain-containing protein [Shewanella sp.]